VETLKRSIRNAIDHGAEKLFPGYFALMMATGIVSIGTYAPEHRLPGGDVYGLHV
jgi:hypothetical protein